jgi:hypothetical protein
MPIAGGTATITAPIASANSYNTGSLQIVGGSCVMGATAMHVAQFVPATGTYTGTVTAFDPTTALPIASSSTTLTVVTSQSATANADGRYPLLSGSATATGNCAGTAALTGYEVSGGLLMPPLGQLAPFIGQTDPQDDLMIATLQPGVCPYTTYTGILTRQ